MPQGRSSPGLLHQIERVVVASVAMTARALGEVAPELTFVQWRVLVLVDTPGGVGVGAIAAGLGGKITATSRLIGRLRARGLVETKRGDADARVVLVSLTERGRELRGRVVERREADLRVAIARADLHGDAEPVIGRLAAVLEAPE